MSRVRLSADGCLGLRPCCAGPDALVPRVIKLSIVSTSAVSEPRTAASTTTTFPRFRDGTAVAAYGPGARRGRDCWYSYVSIGQKKQRGKRSAVTV